jgi:hypothetical protein
MQAARGRMQEAACRTQRPTSRTLQLARLITACHRSRSLTADGYRWLLHPTATHLVVAEVLGLRH